MHYPKILEILKSKPVFTNTPNALDAFFKYFNKSVKFSNLFYINFISLLLLFNYGFFRLVLGVIREKPIKLIAIMIAVVLLIIGLFLYRLIKLIATKTIPTYYKKEIIPKLDKEELENNWQWQYFLLGAAVLTTSFKPIVNYIDKKSSFSDSCGTSCGSSCSSCSSCGGCGD